jgi:hypothetical protein
MRRVEDITEALWGTRVSPSTVSNLKDRSMGPESQETRYARLLSQKLRLGISPPNRRPRPRVSSTPAVRHCPAAKRERQRLSFALNRRTGKPLIEHESHSRSLSGFWPNRRIPCTH